jgi:hypothetical protein
MSFMPVGPTSAADLQFLSVRGNLV